MKEIENNKLCELEKSILFKYPYYLKEPTDSAQSPSKYQ
jgi:hypothetical protein